MVHNLLLRFQRRQLKMSDKVLIVEDEEKTGKFLKLALEDNNIEVTWVKNGQEALENFKKSQYDLIVLDIQLPGISGDEVLEKVRVIDPYVTIIVYTNSISEHDLMKKFINLDVDAYLNKGGYADLDQIITEILSKLEPFSIEEMNELVDNLPEASDKRKLKEN